MRGQCVSSFLHRDTTVIYLYKRSNQMPADLGRRLIGINAAWTTSINRAWRNLENIGNVLITIINSCGTAGKQKLSSTPAYLISW